MLVAESKCQCACLAAHRAGALRLRVEQPRPLQGKALAQGLPGTFAETAEVRLHPPARAPRSPIPAAPVPPILIHHSRHLLLIGEMLLEHLLFICAIIGLCSDVETVAIDRIGIDIFDLIAARPLDELVRRQLMEFGLARGCISGKYCEASRSKAIFFLGNSLLACLAAGDTNATDSDE